MIVLRALYTTRSCAFKHPDVLKGDDPNLEDQVRCVGFKAHALKV